MKSAYGFEVVLAALSSVCGVAAFIVLLVPGPWAGTLPLDLYQYFGLATLVGWLSGNISVQRRQRLPPLYRRRVGWLYLVGPMAIVWLVRGLAPTVDQARAPLAPIYASGVLAIFYLLPVTLRRS